MNQFLRQAVLRPRSYHSPFFTSAMPSHASSRSKMLLGLRSIQLCRHGATRFYSYAPSDEWSRMQRSKTVIWTIIGLNTAVFGAWQYARSSSVPLKDRLPVLRYMERNFLMSWDHIKSGRWWTALTAAFSHIEINHFLVNMISFHQLSQILVYTPGLQAGTIATLALGSAVAGSVAFVAHQEATKNPHTKSVGLGASGMVMGITGAVACLAPRQKMAIFGIIPVPMWAIGVFTAVYNGYFVGASSRVAHDAHLGGAIFGVLFYILRLRKFGGIMGGSSRNIWPKG